MAQISGAGLGFAIDNVGGVIAGAQMAGQMYDYIHPETFDEIDDNPFTKRPKNAPSSFTQKIQNMAPQRNRGNKIIRRTRKMLTSKSKYKRTVTKRKYVKRKSAVRRKKGKLSRRKKKTKSYMQEALRKGFAVTNEAYGGVSDPNAAYIIHGTYSRSHYARAICGCLLRKLFWKAGLHVGDLNTELPLYDPTDSDGFKLTAERKTLDGTVSVFEYITINNQTFNDVLTAWTDLNTYILTFLDDTNTHIFTRLLLYSSDRDVAATNWRFKTALNLEQEKLSIHASSLLKVQNRTRGDQATTHDIANAVDEQNLSARVYNFKHSHPNVANYNSFNHEWNSLTSKGYDLIRSASFPVVDYQNMPANGVFTNCSGSKAGVFGAGQVMSLKVNYQRTMLFNKLLKHIAVDFYSGVLAQHSAGKSQMLGTEELIRTDSTNLIQLKYERRFEFGAFLTSAKPPVSVLKELSYGLDNNYAP